MKRILSLVLVLVLVLGSVPVVFADDMTAGKKLKEAGFVSGDPNGDLMEDKRLTREQMMVLIAEMNGVKEEAKTFGIPADFSDVSEDDWFAPYVWYAFYQGWTAGMGDGTFGAGATVDSKMVATFMLKALGYKVADYNKSVAQAKEVGIMVPDKKEMTRADGFEAMWSTVNLPKKGSDVALGVELGKLKGKEKPVKNLEVKMDEVKAIGTGVVEVVFEDDVNAASVEAAAFVVTPRGKKDEIAVKVVKVVGDDRAYVYTEVLEEGAAYTITLGEDSKNFTAAKKETDKPKVDSVKGTDTERVEVKFDQVMDLTSAETIENYSVDKIGTVTAAKLKDDNKTVELTVVGFVKARAAKLTIENVMNVDGVVMSKVSKNFYSKFDKAAPKIDEIVKAKNNVEVIIYFDDEHGVDEKTAEDISNYSIDGLEILKAEAKEKKYDSSKKIDGKDSDYFQRVLLTTSPQKSNKKYTLKVLNMVDGSSAKNAIKKELSKTFYGGKEDKSEPKLKSMEALSLTLVAVEFTENNRLDPVSALDVTNYKVIKDEIDVLDAKFKDDDDEETTIYLTVSEMDKDESSYKFEVSNISDNFGNTMDKAEKKTVKPKDVNHNGPTYVKKIVVEDLENLIVEFKDPVVTKTAEDQTNYEVNEGIGGAVEAEMVDGTNNKVKIKFPEMKKNKGYKLMVKNVETFSGYAIADNKTRFIATATEADFEKPTVESVDNDKKGIFKVTFSEEVKGTSDLVQPAFGSQGKEAKETDPHLVVITKRDPEGNEIETKRIPAVGKMGENDEILVFDASIVEGADTEYDIKEFVNIIDLAGNKVDYKSNEQQISVSSDKFGDDDKITYDNVDQENIKTVRVVFDSDVLVRNGQEVDLKVKKGGIRKFTVAVDDDYDNEVVLKQKDGSLIKDDAEVSFSLKDIVFDRIGRSVKDQNIELTWDGDDDVDPEIVEVRAISKREIEIRYDEDMSTVGSYKLTWEDDGKDKSKTLSSSKGEIDEDDENLITFTLDWDLDPDIYYTLKQSSGARDLAGNTAKKIDDGFEFVGSGVPYVAENIDGIKLINGTKVVVKDNERLEGRTLKYVLKNSKNVFVSGTAVTTSAAIKGVTVNGKEATLVVANNDAFIDGTTYTVEVFEEGSSIFSDTFKGIIEVLKIEKANSRYNTIKVDGLSLDDGQYVEVYKGSVMIGTSEKSVKTAKVTGSVVEVTTNFVVKDMIKVVVLEETGIVKYVTEFKEAVSEEVKKNK